jgi:hypothetical protein
MSRAVAARCHVAVVSACDDVASSVCHQLGRDLGDESFSGFEFRYSLHSDRELQCHLLHERCPEIASQWPSSVDRIAKTISNFFALDSRQYPNTPPCNIPVFP